MTQLNDLLSQLTKSSVVKTMGKQVAADPNQVKQLIQLGLPTLIQAMNQNASTPQGAKSLAKALDDHKDDPVSNISAYLKNVDTQDGAKILGHVLGSKSSGVERKLSAQTGLQPNQVSGVLSQLAPVLMGLLGQQKAQQGVSVDGLGMLLGGLLGNSDMMGMVTSLLDSDKDGDVMDDVSKLLGGFFGKK
jgi:hypothetical protein